MPLSAKNATYTEYVKEKTPAHNLLRNLVKAFLTGGSLCALGQFIQNTLAGYGLEKEACASWTAISMIFLGILLTGLNLYPKLAKWGGAGALVPITGFANSIVAPAIEYKKEGQIFGIGCKIFTIAGPVILYGIVTSWGLGLIYYLMKLFGF